MILLLARGSRPLGLFLFYFLHTLFLFSFLLWCFGFFLGFVFFYLAVSFMDFRGLLWAIFLTSVVSCSLFRIFLMDMISDFIFFSFVGGLRGAEPSSLLGDFLFFIGSLLQRRKIHSDFVGLTSPRGGKGPYLSFLTLRPGLLLVVTCIFSVIMEFNTHTHTHTHTFSRPRGEFLSPTCHL